MTSTTLITFRCQSLLSKRVKNHQSAKKIPTRTATITKLLDEALRLHEGARTTQANNSAHQDTANGLKRKEYLRRRKAGETRLDIEGDLGFKPEEDRKLNALFETLVAEDLTEDIPELLWIMQTKRKTLPEAIKYFFAEIDKCLQNCKQKMEQLEQENKELRKAVWALERQVWSLRFKRKRR